MKKEKLINPNECQECPLFKQDLCTGYHYCGDVMTTEECEEMKQECLS